MARCCDCKNYCSLINQGIWWCNIGGNMDANNCDNYESYPQSYTISVSTTMDVKENGGKFETYKEEP